jgi:hypothetical protein
MDCDVCSQLHNDFQRESEIEARAILEHRSRWAKSGEPAPQSPTPETEAIIESSRKRQMQIAEALNRHRNEQHSAAACA